MDEMEKLELIDRYLRNELSGTEKTTFEQKVGKNADFKQELEDMQISQEMIRSYAMREEIKSIRKAMLQENKSNTSTSSPSFKFYAVRIAASILLVVVALAAFQYASLSGDSLYAEKAMIYPTETTRSGQEDTDISAEELAISYYRLDDFQRYIEHYEQLTSPSIKATFLAGNAYLQLSDNEKAISAFNIVLEQNDPNTLMQFQEDAEYFLALAMIKNGDYEQAYALMETIANNPDHRYHDMVDTFYLWKLKIMQWKAS